MRARALASILCVAPLLGCGTAGERDDADRAAKPRYESVSGGAEAVAAPATPSCRPGDETALGDRRAAFAAEARGRVVAYVRPEGARLRTFGARNVNGVRTVFGIIAAVHDRDCDPVWYRVQLPIRPNGATGFVRAKDVSLVRVRTRIVVDLSARAVDFFRDGRRVLRARAAIGSDATPTPTGRYYVNQRLLAGDPTGPYGPGGIGISAFSPVLTGWAQGGPIAIHGTNDLSSIGGAVSNGCVRIRNDHVARMLYENPEGTPVVIRA